MTVKVIAITQEITPVTGIFQSFRHAIDWMDSMHVNRTLYSCYILDHKTGDLRRYTNVRGEMCLDLLEERNNDAND